MPYARADNSELYYEEEGAGDALILIMGLGASHSGWFLQVPAFRKHFRVITYDARGVGLSRDSGEPYTMRTLADDAVAILDHLDIERSHVLGLSLGGMVAQEVAITYPDRVHKLVLAATTPGGREQEVAPAIRKAFGIDPDADLSAVDLADYAARGVDMKEVGAIITRLSFNNPLVPWALMKLAQRQGKPPLDAGADRQTQASATADTVDRLHLIQAPTLVITGAKDRIIAPGASEVLASRIPNSTLKLLKGAPHALNLESFRRFNRAVLRFLEAGSGTATRCVP
jgi:pimeloyl-ACP methyl ester carboxylesterase